MFIFRIALFWIADKFIAVCYMHGKLPGILPCLAELLVQPGFAFFLKQTMACRALCKLSFIKRSVVNSCCNIFVFVLPKFWKNEMFLSFVSQGKYFAVHFFVGRITCHTLILLPFVAVIKVYPLPWLFVKAVAIERWHKQRLRYWCQDIFIKRIELNG